MTLTKMLLLAAASITCLACGDDSASNDPSDAGIDEKRIRVELFTSAPREPAQAYPAPVRSPTASARGVGLVLLAAYLAQGLFHWEWPWLTALQEMEDYRRWSGAFLLLFIAAQWVLPVLRIRERVKAASVAYRWHRWIGSFAPLYFYLHASWLGFGYLLAGDSHGG